QPSISFSEPGPEEECGCCPARCIGCAPEPDLRLRARPGLVLKLVRVNVYGIVEFLEECTGKGRKPHGRALVGDQALPIDQKFVPLGLASEYGMILQDEARALASSLALKKQC